MSKQPPEGVGLGHIMFGRPWVGEFDRGWAIAVGASFIEGYFDSPETAYAAWYDFSDAQLARLRPIWLESGENRPVTMPDLDELSRSLPPPWYWRVAWMRHAVIAADRHLPEWLKPWGWDWKPPRK